MTHFDPVEAKKVFPIDGWVKSFASQADNNQCVQWNRIRDDLVGLRDSKQPDGPVLAMSPDQWASFQGFVLSRMNGSA